MSTARLSLFRANLTRARDMVGFGQSFDAMTDGLVDAADMYRAGLVQAVAAIDLYCHGVVLDRAVEILMGRISSGKVNARIGLHLFAVQELLAAQSIADREMAARTHVAERLSRETFQRADSIAEALAIVGVAKIWTCAFPSAPQSAMTALNLVVARRNRIVHEGDCDPIIVGQVTPLSYLDAKDSIDTVEVCVTAIDQFC